MELSCHSNVLESRFMTKGLKLYMQLIPGEDGRQVGMTSTQTGGVTGRQVPGTLTL